MFRLLERFPRQIASRHSACILRPPRLDRGQLIEPLFQVVRLHCGQRVQTGAEQLAFLGRWLEKPLTGLRPRNQTEASLRYRDVDRLERIGIVAGADRWAIG